MLASPSSFVREPLKKPKYSEYNAVELAQYIIDESREMGQSINNLQLQKILFFAWLHYYRSTEKILFENPICAWRFGPVVPDVYDWFKVWGTSPLPCQNNKVVFKNDFAKSIVANCIRYYCRIPTLKLSEMSRVADGAWDMIFRHGEGNGFVIPFELMKKTLEKENLYDCL